jgi:hypothetical protein
MVPIGESCTATGPAHLDYVIVVNAKMDCRYPTIAREKDSETKAHEKALLASDLRPH